MSSIALTPYRTMTRLDYTAPDGTTHSAMLCGQQPSYIRREARRIVTQVWRCADPDYDDLPDVPPDQGGDSPEFGPYAEPEEA